MNHRVCSVTLKRSEYSRTRSKLCPLTYSIMNNVTYCRDETEFTGQIWVVQVIIFLQSELIPHGSRIVNYGNVRLGQQRALVANNNVALIFNGRSLAGPLLCAADSFAAFLCSVDHLARLHTLKMLSQTIPLHRKCFSLVPTKLCREFVWFTQFPNKRVDLIVILLDNRLN